LKGLSLREGEQTFHVNSISLAADAKQINEVPLVVVEHLQERSIDLKEIMVDAFKRELRQDTTVDEFIDFLRLLLLEGFLFLKGRLLSATNIRAKPLHSFYFFSF